MCDFYGVNKWYMQGYNDDIDVRFKIERRELRVFLKV